MSIRVTPPPNMNPHAPSIRLPTGSIDAHVHMFGPNDQYQFAPDANYLSEDATAEMYFGIQDRLGLSRAVLVSGGGYGQCFAHLADTLRRHPDRLRGVARLPVGATAEDVAQLNAVGVRGARFFGPARLPGMTDRLLGLTADHGWHIQFHTEPHKLPEIADRLRILNRTVVLDHFGNIPAEAGLNSPAARALLDLIDTGRFWVKLSGPMRVSAEGHPYPSVTPIAQELIRRAPERLVWGSDWPHTLMWDKPMPDDGDLVDLIADWMPDEATRQRILVDNPMKLYDF